MVLGTGEIVGITIGFVVFLLGSVALEKSGIIDPPEFPIKYTKIKPLQNQKSEQQNSESDTQENDRYSNDTQENDRYSIDSNIPFEQLRQMIIQNKPNYKNDTKVGGKNKRSKKRGKNKTKRSKNKKRSKKHK